MTTPNDLHFPDNVHFVTRDMTNDCRRIAALILVECPALSLSHLISMVSFQCGLALGGIVDRSAIDTIGAKVLTDANYQFAHGTIAAMTGTLK